MPILIEACVASVESAVAAELGGADRLELNNALELDGLTPSPGLVRETMHRCRLPIIAMVRPRNYGFAYSLAEFEIMRRDIDLLLDLGVKGIATGVLTSNHKIDTKRMRRLVSQAGDAEVVVHRAFDITPDPFEALEQLIDCGVHRVLTSGQAPTAEKGVAILQRLNEMADGKIEILPGCGVNASNVRNIIDQTGCHQIHGTFSSVSNAIPPQSGLERLKAAGPKGTSSEVVSAIRLALRGAGS